MSQTRKHLGRRRLKTAGHDGSAMPLKAITFDFWGTLYHGSRARDVRMQRLVEVLRAHGHEFETSRLDAADGVAWREWERAWREDFRTLSARDWLSLMLNDLSVRLPPTVFEALAQDFNEAVLRSDPPLQLVDGAAEAVRRLARRYRLGIISDTGLSDGRTLRRILERDALLGRFACPSFSDELGVSKPHADAFRRTLACLDVRPEEAVHIGDLTRTDIAGARAVGMRAVRLTAVNDDTDRSVAPDATISSYADFERLIQAWDSPD